MKNDFCLFRFYSFLKFFSKNNKLLILKFTYSKNRDNLLAKVLIEANAKIEKKIARGKSAGKITLYPEARDTCQKGFRIAFENIFWTWEEFLNI